MRSLQITDKQEQALQIVDADMPEMPANSVLVKLKAAALNRRDYWISIGKYPGIRPGVILGSDGCGIVEKANSEQGQAFVGKEVIINPNINWGNDPKVQSADYTILGMPVNGTFAEYIAVPVDRIHEKPSHLSVEEAAALPLAGLTAYRALFTHGQVDADKKVFISGAGGGVAQYAFLFSRAVGATTYISSGQAEKVEKFASIGAAKAYNYKDDGWIKQAAKDSGGIDVVIDSAGGDQLNDFLKVLNPAGKIVFYGATTGLPSKIDLYRMFWSQATLQGSTMGNDQEFEAMIEFVKKHRIKPIVEPSIAFDQAHTAFEMLADNKQFGKVVLKMDE
ncbi:MAG: zinc-binding dehydrogenase [Cyclobacteriaceae bacterium]|nr:zinc-binding dehydrogenase [Cyclobacteriaceae bacterium]MCH8517857.1 zinc-binding dehydrogenase [Cyclobacteriaceae bacterium]